MYDLHCHLIPGLDDGAQTAEEALCLLRLAQHNGISHIVMTPHINPGHFDNTKATIHQGLVELQQLAKDHQLPVQLAAAAEVRLCTELPAWVEAAALPYLGEYQGYQVLLLEFPHSHIPTGTDRLVKWLVAKNVLPMIAHPERNREIQADPNKLLPFRRLGCLLQLTASSVLGDMGERSQQTALELLRQKAFHIVATDSHNLHRRPPKLAEARDLITSLFGDDYARQLVIENPKAISQIHFSEDTYA
jgi:protein-tyrosine phosphatase